MVLPDDAKPAFTMETSTASSVLAPYVDAAREALAKVGDIPEVSKVLTSLDFAVSRKLWCVVKEADPRRRIHSVSRACLARRPCRLDVGRD